MLAIGIMLVACSAPKYTYNFDRYPIKSKPTLAKENTLIWSDEESVMASASNEMPFLSHNQKAFDVHHVETFVPVAKRAHPKGLMKSVREFKVIKKTLQEPTKGGDKTKNKYATLGWVSFLLSLVTMSSVGLILFLLAIPFFVTGLKSENRGVAKAGLIAQGAFIILIVVLFIALLNSHYF